MRKPMRSALEQRIPGRQRASLLLEHHGHAVADRKRKAIETAHQHGLLAASLLDAGLPSLWCPKAIVPVPEIPVLASGKLDLKGCQNLAEIG